MHAATGLKALAAAPGCAPARISEAIRLRLAAALLDLGNHLMLSADERKAFRLRGWLSSGLRPQPSGRVPGGSTR